MQDNTLGKAIDLDLLRGQMGALDDSAAEMMEMFVEMTEGVIADLQQAHQGKEYNKCFEIAHSLKGAARSASCMRLGDFAAQIQERARAKENIDELVKQTAEEFGRVQKEVRLLRAQVGA